MIHIMGVELRRFAWRRSFHVFGLLALAGIAVAAVIVFINSEQVEGGAVQAESEELIQQCARSFEAQQAEVPPGFEDAEAFCRQQIAAFQVDDDTFRLADLQDVFEGTSVPLIILGLAIGASFIGAEWHTGTITTLLTWEPRRTRVMIGKVTAVVLGVFLSAIAIQTILGVVMWPIAAIRGTTEGVDAGWLVDSAAVIARGALIAGLAAAIGFAVASVARNTTTALIIGFVYFAVVEGLLRGLRPNWQEWLIGDNAGAFVTADPESVFSFGQGHGVVASLLVVVSYALAFNLVATAWFRARDVT